MMYYKNMWKTKYYLKQNIRKGIKELPSYNYFLKFEYLLAM